MQVIPNRRYPERFKRVQLSYRLDSELSYEGAHIPGALFAGPSSTADGLAHLKQIAANIPRNKEIVLYCGCCPWEKCPNIRPAYDALRSMGFSRLVVLLNPNDFAHDWIGRGFPIARGK